MTIKNDGRYEIVFGGAPTTITQRVIRDMQGLFKAAVNTKRLEVLREENDLSFALGPRWSRACRVCGDPHPRERVIFMHCGTAICSSCSKVASEEEGGEEEECPHCEEWSPFIRLFEDEKETVLSDELIDRNVHEAVEALYSMVDREKRTRLEEAKKELYRSGVITDCQMVRFPAVLLNHTKLPQFLEWSRNADEWAEIMRNPSGGRMGAAHKHCLIASMLGLHELYAAAYDQLAPEEKSAGESCGTALSDRSPTSVASFSRACGVCYAPNPAARVVFIQCGHVDCLACDEQLRIDAGNRIVVCPYCREEGATVRLREFFLCPHDTDKTELEWPMAYRPPAFYHQWRRSEESAEGALEVEQTSMCSNSSDGSTQYWVCNELGYRPALEVEEGDVRTARDIDDYVTVETSDVETEWMIDDDVVTNEESDVTEEESYIETAWTINDDVTSETSDVETAWTIENESSEENPASLPLLTD